MIARLIRWIERPFVYVPERTLKGTPEHIGLEYEDLWLDTPDGVRLHGWHIPGPSCLTFLFLHGNGGNISSRLDWLLEAHRRLGAGIVAVDYRGFGLSGGIPSEPGTHLDALTALEAVQRRRPARGRLVYFGRSMGGAVAARLAVTHPPDALILEASPPSIPSIAQYQHWWMRNPVLKRLMRTRYETERFVKQVGVPVMVIHGESDRQVPLDSAKRLFNAANEPKVWLSIRGAGHDRIDLDDPELYYSALASFLDDPPA